MTIAALAVIFLLIVWYQFHDQILLLIHHFSDRKALISEFQHHGPLELIIYAALLLLCMWLPGAPVAVLAVIAGVCFGHWTAFILNSVVMTVGNFIIANILPEMLPEPKNKFSKALYGDLMKVRHPRIGIILGYAIPLFPSTVINLAAKRLIHNRWSLLLLCWLGSLPPAWLYAFGGDAALHGNLKRVTIIIVIGLVLFGGLWIIHTDRKKKTQSLEES